MKQKKKQIQTAPVKKRARISQSDIPKCGFKESLSLARKLDEEFNGSAAPHQLAIAAGISPTSSGWKYITGAAVAYGLTEGAYNAQEITLSELAGRILSPTEEGDDAVAKIEAALKPRVVAEFYKKYNRGKFPSETIGKNVLKNTLGVPQESVEKTFEIIKGIGTFTGIIHETKTGLFVAVDTPQAASENSGEGNKNNTEANDPDQSAEDFAKSIAGEKSSPLEKKAVETKRNNRVFITHGKNRDIVSQLKELLKFGKFEPVVSVENETLSIPVPEKVMQDMRSCAAAVIHVVGEGEVLDAKGNKHIHINPNVLIEIGAAMALYEKSFVLLVHRGVQLPSNLQGLYRCEYEGEKLDYDATMKLLKTFNEFNNV